MNLEKHWIKFGDEKAMIHNRKVAALIPIKQHSERVKDKNFRNFAGKPLFHYVLSTLERTYAVDDVIIDTDSHLVMSEAPKQFSKVKILERPEKLRGDFESVNNIIAHDISIHESDIFLQTHVTNPLIKAETIGEALKAFIEGEESGYDSLFTVNRYQTRFFTHSGEPINHSPDELIRTQDLNPVYEENSNLYIFTKDSFESTNARIGEKPQLFEMPRIESIDIDDEFTFHLAEILALYAKEYSEKS
ncbi:acylneuraminate cytidylyltransferase family protein [Candidatus Neomarinimicrobiota bacterium]